MKHGLHVNMQRRQVNNYEYITFNEKRNKEKQYKV